MYHGDKKHYCGTYKGYGIWQLGQFIGSNWYGTFYATKKIKVRSRKVENSEHRSLEALKSFIDNLKKG